jgi:hypothetical protein
MSRITRAGALLGTSAALTMALTGAAHAAPATQTTHAKKAATCLVYVFSSKNYKGQVACITESYKNLAAFSWPNGARVNDSISSLQVDKNCTLKLYRNANYKGANSVWKRSKNFPGAWSKDANLSNNAVGDNTTSSIWMKCYTNV